MIPSRSLVVGIPGQVVRAVTDNVVSNTLHASSLYVELGKGQLEEAGLLVEPEA